MKSKDGVQAPLRGAPAVQAGKGRQAPPGTLRLRCRRWDWVPYSPFARLGLFRPIWHVPTFRAQCRRVQPLLATVTVRDSICGMLASLHFSTVGVIECAPSPSASPDCVSLARCGLVWRRRVTAHRSNLGHAPHPPWHGRYERVEYSWAKSRRSSCVS